MIRSKFKNENESKTDYTLVFLFIFYLPFCIHILRNYEVAVRSLSCIGWRLEGFGLLLFYGPATAAFLLRQFKVNDTLSKRESGLLKLAQYIAVAFFLLAVFIPFREKDSAFVLGLHSTCGYIGAVALFSIIAYLVFSQLKKTAAPVLTVSLFCVLLVAVVVMFALFRSAALFELCSSFGFMLALALLNRGLEAKKGTEEVVETEAKLKLSAQEVKTF